MANTSALAGRETEAHDEESTQFLQAPTAAPADATELLDHVQRLLAVTASAVRNGDMKRE